MPEKKRGAGHSRPAPLWCLSRRDDVPDAPAGPPLGKGGCPVEAVGAAALNPEAMSQGGMGRDVHPVSGQASEAGGGLGSFCPASVETASNVVARILDEVDDALDKGVAAQAFLAGVDTWKLHVGRAARYEPWLSGEGVANPGMTGCLDEGSVVGPERVGQHVRWGAEQSGMGVAGLESIFTQVIGMKRVSSGLSADTVMEIPGVGLDFDAGVWERFHLRGGHVVWRSVNPPVDDECDGWCPILLQDGRSNSGDIGPAVVDRKEDRIGRDGCMALLPCTKLVSGDEVKTCGAKGVKMVLELAFGNGDVAIGWFVEGVVHENGYPVCVVDCASLGSGMSKQDDHRNEDYRRQEGKPLSAKKLQRLHPRWCLLEHYT